MSFGMPGYHLALQTIWAWLQVGWLVTADRPSFKKEVVLDWTTGLLAQDMPRA